MKLRSLLVLFLLAFAPALFAQTGRVYTGASPNTNSGNAGVQPRFSSCPSNTDTILATDRAGVVAWTDSSACAVMLPQAGTAGFGNNFVFEGCNSGTGTVTVTPTTSNVSIWTGSAYSSAQMSATLTTGQCGSFRSNNTNYFMKLNGGGGGGSSTPTYDTPSSAVHASITATTMTTNAAATHFYNVKWVVDETTVGTACVGNTSIVLNLIYTDPNASSATTLAVATLSVSGNGAVGQTVGVGGSPVLSKASQTIQYSTTYTADSACSTGPTYQVYPVLTEDF